MRSEKLVGKFLQGRRWITTRLYRYHMDDFRDFLGVENIDTALRILFVGGPSGVQQITSNYRSEMTERGLSKNTITARISVLRSLIKLAFEKKIISWTINFRI